MSRKIDQTMGPKTIGELVTSFNFKQIDEKNSSGNDHLNIRLAPAYGKTTNSDAIQRLDENQRLAIAGVVKTLGRIPGDQWNWDTIVSQFFQNPLLEPDTNIGTARSDKLTVRSSSDLKSSDAVKKTQDWFTRLINDDDVLSSTRIDTNVLTAIVEKSVGIIDVFDSVPEEWHEKTLLDICVLRFPDSDKPHFQLYRIRLSAWANSHMFPGFGEKTCGITGEYNSRLFKPRESVLRELRQEVKDRVASEAASLFGPA